MSFSVDISDFPAGFLVKFLVGFTNKGDKDFVVDSMDASFRYPQDYSFHIQNVGINFSYERLSRTLKTYFKA